MGDIWRGMTSCNSAFPFDVVHLALPHGTPFLVAKESCAYSCHSAWWDWSSYLQHHAHVLLSHPECRP